MKVTFPDNETELTVRDLVPFLAHTIQSVLEPGTRVSEISEPHFSVRAYWIMPSDARGSAVLRVDAKMSGMMVEMGPLPVEGTENLTAANTKE